MLKINKFEKISQEIGKEEYLLMILNSPDLPYWVKNLSRMLTKGLPDAKITKN